MSVPGPVPRPPRSAAPSRFPEVLRNLRQKAPGSGSDLFRRGWGRNGDPSAFREEAAWRARVCREELRTLLSSPDPDRPAEALRRAWDLADLASNHRTYSRTAGDLEGVEAVCRRAEALCRRLVLRPDVAGHVLAHEVLES